MTTSRKIYKLNKEYEVAQPKRDIAYPIPKGDWEHIKRRIENLNFNTSIYTQIGSFLIGIGITALGCALSYPNPNSNDSALRYSIVWIITVLGLVIGSFCYLFEHKLKGIRQNEVKDIIEEMEANEPHLES